MKFLSKIILRRLPPSMTEEQLVQQISPIPQHDYFYFGKSDRSLGQFGFTWACINFSNQQDLFLFKDKFDGYVFLDTRGNEYPAIVEFAPHQNIPKRRRNADGQFLSAKSRDSKCGTIENDASYIEFIADLEEAKNNGNFATAEVNLEEIEARERELKEKGPNVMTPLIEYIKERRQRLVDRKEDRRRIEIKKRQTEKGDRRERERHRARRREFKDDKSLIIHKGKNDKINDRQPPLRVKVLNIEGSAGGETSSVNVNNGDNFNDKKKPRIKVLTAESGGDGSSKGNTASNAENVTNENKKKPQSRVKVFERGGGGASKSMTSNNCDNINHKKKKPQARVRVFESGGGGSSKSLNSSSNGDNINENEKKHQIRVKVLNTEKSSGRSSKSMNTSNGENNSNNNDHRRKSNDSMNSSEHSSYNKPNRVLQRGDDDHPRNHLNTSETKGSNPRQSHEEHSNSPAATDPATAAAAGLWRAAITTILNREDRPPPNRPQRYVRERSRNDRRSQPSESNNNNNNNNAQKRRDRDKERDKDRRKE